MVKFFPSRRGDRANPCNCQWASSVMPVRPRQIHKTHRGGNHSLRRQAARTPRPGWRNGACARRRPGSVPILAGTVRFRCHATRPDIQKFRRHIIRVRERLRERINTGRVDFGCEINEHTFVGMESALSGFVPGCRRPVVSNSMSRNAPAPVLSPLCHRGTNSPWWRHPVPWI
jgi:hypothetical protein